jgi:hypothetical protein
MEWSWRDSNRRPSAPKADGPRSGLQEWGPCWFEVSSSPALFICLIGGGRPLHTLVPAIVQFDELVLPLDAFVRGARVEYLRFGVGHLFLLGLLISGLTTSEDGAAGTDLFCVSSEAQFF